MSPKSSHRNETELVRLNKFLSMAGFSSRRKADELITEGLITVNGEVVMDLGHKIDPKNDIVFVRERQVTLVRDHVYILFNKPKDAITTMI